MEIASTCLRVLIFGVGYILFSMIFLNSILVTKRQTAVPWVIRGLLWAGKTIILEYVLGVFWGEEIWFRVLKLSYLIVYSTLVYIILWSCMYLGSVLKIGLAQIVCEVNYAVIFGIVLAAINSLEGRGDPMGYALPFMMVDFLTLPLMYFLVKIEIWFLKPLLSWLQTYEPKHRKTGWTIIGLYFISGIATSFRGLINGDVFNGWIMLPILMVSVVGSIACFCLFVQYRSKTENANAFLYTQTSFMDNYLQVLKQQIMKMESSREDLRIDQINMIADQIRHGEISKANQKKLWKYMRDLKKKYEAVQTGIYCNDWLVDGILFYMSKFCRENEMEIVISFQTYDRGEIAEEDIVEIIYQLLTYNARESLLCRKRASEREDSRLKLSLQAAAVKNQLILNGSFYSVKSLKKLERELKRKLSIRITPYDGQIAVFDKEGEEKQISIQMQREKK